MNDEYIGKETTIDFGRDLRMSQPWRSYPSDEVFTIVKKTKSGLYLIRDSKGHEHPLRKSSINYFKKKFESLKIPLHLHGMKEDDVVGVKSLEITKQNKDE